jgi:uncharacterized protein YerC
MRLSKKRIKPDVKNQITNLFFQVIADVRSPKEAKIYLEAILTKAELLALAKRLAVVVYLEKGQSYEEIKNSLKISSATIASIADQLNSDYGYQIALEKIKANQWAEKWAKKISQMLRGK